MMRILLAFAVALATMTAHAQECEPSTSSPEVETQNGFYVDNDNCQPECNSSVWVYQESNRISGLQRGDEVVDDTCGGQIESDTIIF